MRVSRRFINFAIVFCLGLLMTVLTDCKGRTFDNMEPTGDTVEVVIVRQDTIVNN